MADYNQAAAPRDRSLDIARALAMFYIIVLWHLLGYTGAFSFVPYGGEYITSVFLGLFFVISGYLLAAKYRITGSTELKRFVSSRVLRIMPLYALSLATFAILSYCTVRTALLALTGLSTFIPPQPYTLWFVAMLLVFYLGFMVSGLRYCYAIWGGMYGLCLTATQFYDGIDPRLFLYFPCFIFGVFLQKRGRTSLITRGGGIALLPYGSRPFTVQNTTSGCTDLPNDPSVDLGSGHNTLVMQFADPFQGDRRGCRIHRLLFDGRLPVPSPGDAPDDLHLLARQCDRTVGLCPAALHASSDPVRVCGTENLRSMSECGVRPAASAA